ncbi:MAG: type IV pilus assembly protein PilM [Candidatus Omnitrophota bacterium]
MIKLGNIKQSSVGLDIGTNSVKIACLRKNADKNTLLGYNIKNLPFDIKPDHVIDVVREAFEEIELSPDEINLSISGPEVIVRFVDLPKMTKEQLESALVFEAEKYIPFNINDVMLDFIILGDSSEPGQMKVLLAAAKKEAINSRLSMAENLGMAVNLLDINSFAMFNAFLASNQEDLDGKGIAFFDLGYSDTNVIISTGKVPSFMRLIQIGTKDIISAMSRNLSIPIDQVDALMMGKDEASNNSIREGAGSILDDLVNEMQLSFGYFENRSNIAVKEVFCSGGMVHQQVALDYLSQKLEVTLKKWNPLEGLILSESLSGEDLEKAASQLAVAVGLALRD